MPGKAGEPGEDDPRAPAIAALIRDMQSAAEALDFERARILRDRINLLRGGATLDDALAADTRDLQRQIPGRMALGSSQQRVTPPPGWRPPDKPDPMTRATTRRGRKGSE